MLRGVSPPSEIPTVNSKKFQKFTVGVSKRNVFPIREGDLESGSPPASSGFPHKYAFVFLPGTSVIQLTASDADDPTYGNSARVVYSILEGQPYFSVDAKTGERL